MSYIAEMIHQNYVAVAGPTQGRSAQLDRVAPVQSQILGSRRDLRAVGAQSALEWLGMQVSPYHLNLYGSIVPPSENMCQCSNSKRF